MKKSLSLTLSFALVSSMFASVAFGAEATMDTNAKYEALKAKGIFEGTDGGAAALDAKMTRAQFSKIVTLLKGLSEDASSASVYKDLAGSSWANGFIGAVTKAKYMDGKAVGKFDPTGNVKTEELAAVLVRVFELPQSTTAVTGNVDTWAKGYVAAAIDAGLIVAQGDYKTQATRGQLVEASYTVWSKIEAAQTLSVGKLEATGAKQLKVTFNKAVVDASKIKLSVSKGAASITLASTGAITWNDAKTVATLALDSKLTKGEYAVKVEAAAADNGVKIGTASATVTAEDEKLTEIKFVNTTDTVAKFNGNVIAFSANNQYGEQSDLPANRFTLVTSPTGIATASNEKQEVTLNTSAMAKDSKAVLTIIAPNAQAQVSKVFTVGDTQTVAKVELGDVKLAAGKDRLTAGDTATIPLTAYDQYGNKITDLTTLQSFTTRIAVPSNAINGAVTVNADKNIEFVTAGTVSSDTDVTITVVANGSGLSASKSFKIYAAKTAAEVAFGTYTDTIAKGDTVYLPVTFKDQFGANLSVSDVVYAANNGKLTVYGNNAGVINLTSPKGIEVNAGDNQGKLGFTAVGTGNATITVLINGTGKSATLNVTVQDERVPSSIAVAAEPAGKLLPGSTSTIKFIAKDQYGKEVATDVAGYKVTFTLEKVSGDDNAVTFSSAETTALNTGIHDVAYTFTPAPGKKGAQKLTAKLIKTSDGTVLSSANRTVEAVDASVASDLTYAVTQIGTIFGNFTGAANNADAKTKEAKLVKIDAKDANGVVVAVPSNVVTSVASSDVNVASTVSSTVYGVAEGTATLTVQYEPAVGNVKVATQTVTVSKALPAAATITVTNASKTIGSGSLTGKFVYDAALAGDIKLVDTYGAEFLNADLTAASLQPLTKVTYAITNAKWDDSATARNLSVDANGKITYSATGGKVQSFTVLVISNTNGKTASFNVTVN